MDADLNSPIYLKIEDARQLAALRRALSLFSSVGAGQLEALYWTMFKPGLVPVNAEQLGMSTISEAQLQAVGDLLADLKTLIGLHQDACLPLRHPAVSDLARAADELERQLNELAPVSRPDVSR